MYIDDGRSIDESYASRSRVYKVCDPNHGPGKKMCVNMSLL